MKKNRLEFAFGEEVAEATVVETVVAEVVAPASSTTEKVNTFKRPVAGTPQAQFIQNLKPGNAKKIETYLGKPNAITGERNNYFLITLTDGTVVRVMAKAMSLLQDNNPNTTILANEQGKIAGVDEECMFKTSLLPKLGAKDGNLYIIS